MRRPANYPTGYFNELERKRQRPFFDEIDARSEQFKMEHHRKCAAFPWGKKPCNRNCAEIKKVIDAFNADPAQSHSDNPDSREHYHARFPILATDCDYEISGFSGVQGRNI